MTRYSVSRRVLAVVICLATGLIANQSAWGQIATDNNLTPQAALAILNREVGLWSGTKNSYPNGPNADVVKTKVTVLNKLEANTWLYFQAAEKSELATWMSKGTLAFNPENGEFTRRWFASDNPEIEGCTAKYDTETNTLTYSWTDPAQASIQDTTAYTTEMVMHDANTRLVKVFARPADLPNSPLVLHSELVLTRTAANVAGAKNGASKNDEMREDKKGPFTHTLTVKVFVASNELTSDQKPEIEITPDDGEMKRVDGNTFEFSGLKSGVNYTVDAYYQLPTGLRVQTRGTIEYEFAKDSKANMTKTKTLRLENR